MPASISIISPFSNSTIGGTVSVSGMYQSSESVPNITCQLLHLHDGSYDVAATAPGTGSNGAWSAQLTVPTTGPHAISSPTSGLKIRAILDESSGNDPQTEVSNLTYSV